MRTSHVFQRFPVGVFEPVPVAWLAWEQTGVPVPQAVYGYQLQKLSDAERALKADPREREVIAAYRARADELGRKLQQVPQALAADRAEAQRRINDLKLTNAPQREIQAAERALTQLPKNEAAAADAWQRERLRLEMKARPLAGMPDHALPFAGNPDGTVDERREFELSRRNFLALVFCLMVGTAALPHILTRYYTTPTVREARESVSWSLLFIVLLYLTAPALAVLVKYEVFSQLVGTPIDLLPAWIANWSKVDPSLLSVEDVNHDGILQLGELHIGSEIIVLAMPEIAGLPYVISGMVAAGGLAAALSTADGLLLTIANALSHDGYYQMVDKQASTARRVMLAKVILLAVALAAAFVAAQKPANILFLVSAAFSLAGSAFFPALVLGIFWQRANKWGAATGMLSGLGLCFWYMARGGTFAHGSVVDVGPGLHVVRPLHVVDATAFGFEFHLHRVMNPEAMVIGDRVEGACGQEGKANGLHSLAPVPSASTHCGNRSAWQSTARPRIAQASE